MKQRRQLVRAPVFDEVGRNITPEEFERQRPAFEAFMNKAEVLARQGRAPELVEVLLGTLLRCGVTPDEAWRVVEATMPADADVAGLATVRPMGHYPH